MDEKTLRKKMALFKTDYEKGRGLATPRVNYFLLVHL
jgi:hypothetical protein